jgi:glycosyltransferase involved in cell wall biosynthesis
VIWLLHQHRQAYDLWGTEFGDIHNRPDAEFLRATIIANDNAILGAANRIFTIARNVSDRLLKYNGLASTPLYHPPGSVAELHASAYEPFVFYPSRIDPMKRQRLLIEAAKYCKSDTKIVIAGAGSGNEIEHLNAMIRKYSLEQRVDMVGYVSEAQKIDYLARCGAVFNGAYDEDYGYVTLEAMFSRKPMIALSDGGGAIEFILDGVNGYVVAPDARAVAERIDELAEHPALAPELGMRGEQTMLEHGVSWDHAIDCLLGASRA